MASQNPDDAKSRGSYLVKNHVRSFFVLDCNTGYLYFFKKTTQEKPTKIIHLQGGVISDSEEIFEDPINGEKIPAFELSLKKRTYIIVPEYAIDYDLTLKEFSSCVIKNRPKGHYRKKVAKGAMSVAKIPWNVVRMVTFSLEKIR